MKIEKLSDNQIRCTLNKSDLVSRELKISELAYGSEKAKDLFRDMMHQASNELGFEADDIPLMIEAIPISPDCIILIITKVDDPEELDTRFSKFSPSVTGDDEDESDFPYDDDALETFDNTMEEDNGADDVINLFSKVKDYLNKSTDSDDSELQDTESENNDIQKLPDEAITDNSFIPLNQTLKNESSSNEKSANIVAADTKSDPTPELNVSRIFSFNSLDEISKVAVIIVCMYDGSNSLYKDLSENKYCLLIQKSDCSPKSFNKVCNILSEYGTKEHYAYGSQAYFEEHFDSVIKDKALQVLATI